MASVYGNISKKSVFANSGALRQAQEGREVQTRARPRGICYPRGACRTLSCSSRLDRGALSLAHGEDLLDFR